MKAFITGATGQLGLALQRFAPPEVDVVALGRDALDIVDREAVETILQAGADVLINAAAYTDVEGAEREPSAAFAINSAGAANLAAACAIRGIRLVHVSTDFVFDGTKEAPYSPEDTTNPLNVYGASKLEGERRVLAHLPEACIVRTSWVHSADRANFVTKIVQRMRTGGPLRVVTDEIGSPTAVHSLAPALWRCAMNDVRGIHHWSDAGSTNRFDYARAIASLAVDCALVPVLPEIVPAKVADFPVGAQRPRYSVLAIEATQTLLRVHARPWLEGLKLTMQDLRDKQDRT